MDILEKIVEQKKAEVVLAKRRVSETQLREKASKGRKHRPFFKTLESPGPAGVNIIAEIKRASPSKGIIRQDIDPASVAVVYEKGGASALSVLTDPSFFQGSEADLKTAREAVKLPVLRKDFLISSYQLHEAAVMGADAVLLIARILSQAQLRDYLLLARELNLDALVEVHTHSGLEKASRAGAKLIGINNRNLKSFKTDIKTAARLVSYLEPDQVPVAESGIRSREDILYLQQSGIWNFLIGESLMRAENPESLLSELMGTGE